MRQNNEKYNDPIKDFYFANTYPDDDIKRNSMKNNVRHDLEPFSNYIRASIDCLQKSSTEGADVVISKTQEAYLVPQFTMIKPVLPKNQFEVKKTQDVYILTAEEDFDTETFELTGRKGSICTAKDKLDSYKGSVFVKLSEGNEIIESGQKFDLYDDVAHKDESIKCTIQQVSYSDWNTYRIEGIEIQSVEDAGDKLVFSTEKDISALETITLFGTFELPVIKSPSDEKLVISAKNTNIKQIPDSAYYALHLTQKNIQIFADKKPIKHSVAKLEELSENEVQELLHTTDVSVQNGRLVYRGDEKDSVSFGELNFKIKSEKVSLRRLLKDKNGNYIGTVIEVIANEKSIRDLESNTDAFFKDTTEKLTDELPYNQKECRIFKIGRTDENLSLVEIAEIDKNGHLQKVTEETLPKHLYAIPNDWQLRQQQNALGKLKRMPCCEFEKLLELFERKAEDKKIGAQWKKFRSATVSKWFLLTNDDYEGCNEQREFVQKALATPDFAFLDGPPGSGKTTSILELIAQLVTKGKKVLLTASTNAAVDNILERIETLSEEIRDKIFAVRIGNEGAISDTVQEYTLSDVPQEYQKEIVMRANVVCGTIFGVLKHPAFNLNNRNQPVRPLYDYLIIDEASKTTFQDFLIPALYSRHWVLSGDLKQLTPYVEQETIQSSLEEIPEFDKNHQYIQTMLQLAKENELAKKNVKFYTVVTADQIKAAEELVSDAENMCGIVTKDESGNPYAVSVQELKEASLKTVVLYGAHLLFIEASIQNEISRWLPSDFIPLYDIEKDDHYANMFLAATAKSAFSKIKSVEMGKGRDKGYQKSLNDIADYWKRATKEHSWASEITWRLCRIQELFLEAESGETVKKYKEQIDKRIPSFKLTDGKAGKDKIKEYCNAIAGIALPSILQLLQNGLSEDVRKNFKTTTLNNGFDGSDFSPRHTMLTFQHRMHPSISKFSAQNIYNGKALQDGSELNSGREWDCPVFGANHSVWIDTKETGECKNENPEEIKIIKELLRKFMEWTKSNPKENGNWTVACLTYYKKQERRLKEGLKTLFGEQKDKSWYKSDENHIEVFIYTVDKFQGREADVVFLSLIKNGKVPLGFMDSPNRLNVALTRARFQRVLVGSWKYFRNTRNSKLLNSLAEESFMQEVKK